MDENLLEDINALPTDIDLTYPDRNRDSAKLHQQHHDTLHRGVQVLSTDLGSLTETVESINIAVNDTAIYGNLIDTTVQTVGLTTSAYAIKIGTVDGSYGITNALDDNNNLTKIVFAYDGIYSIVYSIQFSNTSNDAKKASVWLSKNGSSVANSRSDFSVPGRHGAEDGALIAIVEYIVSIDNVDTLQLFWRTESTTVHIETIAAGTNPTTPVSPGVIVTVKRIGI